MHHLILDRMYLHRNPAQNCFRCVAMNSASSAIVDSYLSRAHVQGFDAQAIGGWNGPGPYKIVNNYLEGSGENVMFGGADPRIPDLVPGDIEFRRNHCFKPLSWKIDDPSYAGRPWTVKNLFELKNARRVLIEGNLFEGIERSAFTLTSGKVKGKPCQRFKLTNNIMGFGLYGAGIDGGQNSFAEAFPEPMTRE